MKYIIRIIYFHVYLFDVTGQAVTHWDFHFPCHFFLSEQFILIQHGIKYVIYIYIRYQIAINKTYMLTSIENVHKWRFEIVFMTFIFEIALMSFSMWVSPSSRVITAWLQGWSAVKNVDDGYFNRLFWRNPSGVILVNHTALCVRCFSANDCLIIVVQFYYLVAH